MVEFNQAHLDKISEEMQKQKLSFLALQVNIADEKAAEKIVGKIVDHFERIVF